MNELFWRYADLAVRLASRGMSNAEIVAELRRRQRGQKPEVRRVIKRVARVIAGSLPDDYNLRLELARARAEHRERELAEIRAAMGHDAYVKVSGAIRQVRWAKA